MPYDFTGETKADDTSLELVRDYQIVCALPEGRRVLGHILSQAGMGAGVSDVSLYNFGQAILSEIIEAEPQAGAAILTELFGCQSATSMKAEAE